MQKPANMKETIISYYSGIAQQGYWYLGLGIIGLGLGFLSLNYWGEVGKGLMIITGIFGSFQLFIGLNALLRGEKRVQNKVEAFKRDAFLFTTDEIEKFTVRESNHQRISNFLTVIFLAGMLFLLTGAFAGWSDFILGVGAALAAEGAIQLIMELLSNYRSSFYLLRLRKYEQAPKAFD